MKKLIALFAVIISFLASAQVETDEIKLTPIKMPEEFTIKSGDTKILPLPRFTFIDRLTLEVKTSAFCSDDQFRISFDGESNQTVHVAGFSSWRTKIITATARARNIEIHNSSNCKMKIRQINILPRRFGQPGQNGPVYHPTSDAAAHVSFLLESMLYLDSLMGDADRIQYISPSKKVLGKALAVLNTSPETSQASLKAIQEVIAHLKSIAPFIERLQTIESTFELAQEIQSTQVTLERMTR
jgi:hypothetical protein